MPDPLRSTGASAGGSPPSRPSSPSGSGRYKDRSGKAGRTPKYDWAFIFAKLEELYDSQNPPVSHSACARQIHEWMDARGLDPPEDNYLRQQIASYIRKASLEEQRAGRGRIADLISGISSPLRLRQLAVAVVLLAVGGLGGWFVYVTTNADDSGWPAIVGRAAVTHMAYAPGAQQRPEMSSEDRGVLSRSISEHLGAPVEPPSKLLGGDDYLLVEGRRLFGIGELAAHFIYVDVDDDRMSLYVTNQSHSDPTALMSYAEQGGVGVLYWESGPLAYALCGALKDMDTTELWRSARMTFARPPGR